MSPFCNLTSLSSVDIKKKKPIGWLARKVITKLWTSKLDCSPIDFTLQRYKLFLIAQPVF